jgi:competence protein ComEC
MPTKNHKHALTMALLVAALPLAGCVINGGDADGASDGGNDGGGYTGDGVTLRGIFIDVWQGDSALFLLPDGEVVLVDGGDNTYGNSRVLPVLEEHGVDAIDLVVLTHPHADHCGGLDEVIKAVEVKEIWENGDTADSTAYERFVEARDDSGADVLIPEAGYARSFGEVSLEVLATASGYAAAGDDESDGLNNDSIVMMLEYRDMRFLLAADAEREEQEDILGALESADLVADVLKVPHHGSYNFANDFPPTVSPEYAVISCGAGNDYGHPHQEALAAYNAIGAAICRTDLLGDVDIATDGTAIETDCGE